MKPGDLVRIIRSGKLVVYLGTDGGCYQFWHHKWQMVWFAVEKFPHEKCEVIG